MIIDELTEVMWRGSTNKEYYTSLGYTYTKEFDKFMVSILHLPPSTNNYVHAKCDRCGDIKRIRRRSYKQTKDRYAWYICSKCVSILKFKVEHPWIDIYDEFKERGATLLPQLIEHHKEKVTFVCDTHKVLQTVILHNFWNNPGSGCKLCRSDGSALRNRNDYNQLVSMFDRHNSILLSGYSDYKDSKSPLEFVCLSHLGHPQITNCSNIWQVYNERVRHICKYCQQEERKKELSTAYYMRSQLQAWKLTVIQSCNGKCDVTGSVFTDVHHVFPFRKIVSMAIANLKLVSYRDANRYKQDVLVAIQDEVNRLHMSWNGVLGVCLTREIHDLFHRYYRYNFDYNDYLEFKDRYNSGEFTEELNAA